MPQLFNIERQAWEDTPGDQVTDAVASGGYTFAQGGTGKIPVLAPDGTPGEIPIEHAKRLFAKGYRYETEGDAETRQIHEDVKGGLGALEAGVVGAADMATGGLLSSATAAYDRTGRGIKRIKALKEEQKGASIAGAIGGALVPGFGGIASGIGGRAGRGLAKSVLGEASKTASSSILKRAAARAGRGAFEKGTTGFVEGAIFGGQQLVSEEALGNTEYSVESVLHTVGAGALIGGGIGSALGGLGGGLGGLLSRGQARKAAATTTPTGAVDDVVSAQQATSKAREVVDEVIEKKGMRERVVEKYSEVTESFGHDKKLVEKLLAKGDDGADFRKKIFAGPDARDEAGERVYGAVADMQKRIAAASKKVARARGKETSSLTGKMSADEAYVKAADALGELQATARRMRAEPELWHSAIVRELELAADGLERRLTEGAANTADDVFKIVDGSKKGLFAKLSKYEGSLDPVIKKTRGEAMAKGYSPIASHLEDVALYNKAGARQAAFNKAKGRFSKAEKQFLKKFGTKTTRGQEIDSAKIKTYLRQVGASGGESRNAMFLDYIDAADDYLRQIDETAKVGGKVDTLGARGSLDAARAGRDSAEETLGQINRLTQHDPFTDIQGNARLDRAIGLLNPYAVAKKLHAVENLMKKSTKRIDKTVERIVEGPSSKVTRKTVKESASTSAKTVLRRGRSVLARSAVKAEKATSHAASVETGDGGIPSTVQTMFTVPLIGKRQKPSASKIRDVAAFRMDEVAKLIADPEALSDRVAASMAGLEEAAPKLAAGLSAQAVRSLQYLHSKMPRRPAPTLMTKMEDWKPSRTEALKFARYYDAVMNPKSILEAVENGTLTNEAAEVMREFYPQMADGIYKGVLLKLAEKSTTLSYDSVRQLSRFTGHPLHASMTPEAIARSQARYQQKPQQGQGGGGMRVQGISKIKADETAMTPTQRREFGT